MGGLLVVAALAEEVAQVRDAEVLVTGVGKAVAAACLARRLASDDQPDTVVNLGTAGALDATMTGVVDVGYVTQHDFPYGAIQALVGPLDRGYLLHPQLAPMAAAAPPADAIVVATGDVFVSDTAHAAAIAATGVHLVDMEAFAYAATCSAFAVPMRCAKAISDTADTAAGTSWLEALDACAALLAEWFTRHYPHDLRRPASP